MGFQDTHDAFVMARKIWDKYDLGVDFDTAWQAYYDAHYDPEHWETWEDPLWYKDAWDELVRENGGDPDSVPAETVEFDDEFGESVQEAFDLLNISGAEVDPLELTNTSVSSFDSGSGSGSMDFETWFNTEGWGQRTGQTFDEYVKEFPNAESLRHATPEMIKKNAYKFYDVWDVDSMDRELAFDFASEKLGIPYDTFYDSWVDEQPLSEDRLKEGKKLNEKHWVLTIPASFRNDLNAAGEDEDVEAAKDVMLGICNYVVQNADKFDDPEYIRDEYRDMAEDIEFADIEDLDEVDWYLDELYDLMDNTSVFLGLGESLKNPGKLLKETYSIVDPITGDKFGTYSDLGLAKAKANQYLNVARVQKVAIVNTDTNDFICGVDRNGVIKEEKLDRHIDLIFSDKGFSGKNPKFGLKVSAPENVYNDLKYYIEKDGKAKVDRQWRINITPCKPEEIFKNSMSVDQFMKWYEDNYSANESLEEDALNESSDVIGWVKKVCRDATNLCEDFYKFSPTTLKLKYDAEARKNAIDKFFEDVQSDINFSKLNSKQQDLLLDRLHKFFDKRSPKQGSTLVFYGSSDLSDVSWRIEKLNESLNEAQFWGKNYRYSVHACPHGATDDKLLGGSNDLDSAGRIAINQAQSIFESPWMSNKEKYDYIMSMYIFDDEEEDEVEPYNFEDFSDSLLSELDSRIKANESLTEGAMTNGSYSLYNGWVKVPDKDRIPDEYPDLEPEYSEWVERAESCKTIEDIDNFLDDVYKLRQSGLLATGEYGKENLIFKELRNNGFLQKIKDLKVELQNKEMSLESLNEGGIGWDSYLNTLHQLEDLYKKSKSFKKKVDKWFTKNNFSNEIVDLYPEDMYKMLSDLGYSKISLPEDTENLGEHGLRRKLFQKIGCNSDGSPINEGLENPVFKYVTPVYTGGGIYVVTGMLESGEGFLADADWFDVRLLDVDPATADWDEELFYDDWQSKHLIRDLQDDEALRFCDKMFSWILANKPDGNYSEGDIENLKARVERQMTESITEDQDDMDWADAEDYDEDTVACDWCEDPVPTSELYKTNFGNLCEYCIQEIKSRGEKITIYGKYDEFED